MTRCKLYDRFCIDCGACDICPYHDRICNNCFECLTLQDGKDFSTIMIDGIEWDESSESILDEAPQ